MATFIAVFAVFVVAIAAISVLAVRWAVSRDRAERDRRALGATADHAAGPGTGGPTAAAGGPTAAAGGQPARRPARAGRRGRR